MRFNDDEDLTELQTYEGPKDCCGHCKKKFQLGELITVSGDGELVFCLFSLIDIEKSDIPCLIKWALAHDQVVRDPVIVFYDGI